jgi:hypothetical protein
MSWWFIIGSISIMKSSMRDIVVGALDLSVLQFYQQLNQSMNGVLTMAWDLSVVGTRSEAPIAFDL